MDSCDVVVIGGGVAGLATAYFLAGRGVEVVVLEKEPVTGAHASGRNAAMLRQATRSPLLATLVAEGSRFLDGGAELVRRNGSFLTGAEVFAPGAPEWPRDSEFACGRCVAAFHPLLEDCRAADFVYTPSDGVIDVHGLLQRFARGGFQLVTGREVTGLVGRARCLEVEFAGGSLFAETVVIAAGAWSARLGLAAGGARLPLVPRRRHLVLSAPVLDPAPDLPFVWFTDEGLYVRPEGRGLLMSPCDEEPHPPGVPSVDERVIESLADKVARRLPSLGGLGIARSWACLRTLTPDREFVVGRDPRVPRLFWVAGLGGHGMGAGPAVGRLASELLCGDQVDVDLAVGIDPRRIV